MSDELANLMRYYQKCAVGGCGSEADQYVTVWVDVPDYGGWVLDAVPLCAQDADWYAARAGLSIEQGAPA